MVRKKLTKRKYEHTNRTGRTSFLSALCVWLRRPAAGAGFFYRSIDNAESIDVRTIVRGSRAVRVHAASGTVAHPSASPVSRAPVRGARTTRGPRSRNPQSAVPEPGPRSRNPVRAPRATAKG